MTTNSTPVNPMADGKYARKQIEKMGVPGWAIAEITKRLKIQPTYARLKMDGKQEALHALYTPMQVLQIQGDYTRAKQETKERRAQAARERFSGSKGQVHRSLRQELLAGMAEINQRLDRLEKHLNVPVSYTQTPLEEGGNEFS